MLERITLPRKCIKPLAYISSAIKKTTLKMSEHRSVCGSDGGLQFLRSVNQLLENHQKAKNQTDQKLGVLENQAKHLELRNNLLDARMKDCESKLNFAMTQLGLRESEIVSQQETYEERMSSLKTLVEQVEKRLTNLESISSTSRQPFQTESSYQRFLETRLYELECEAFGATEEHEKRIRHEFVHGGCIRADIQAIEGASITDTIRSLRVLEGFQNCYGITVSHFKEVFQGAPPEVLDTLDKRMNLRKVRFWQDGKNIEARDKLIPIANQIVEKWENGFHDALDDLYQQLKQQYDDCMRKA